ncbi:MAG: B12-binding domain-containing radical SAM protein [Bacteroidales bacterium]|nr:B12-binding domain-containing radical SAM protein [Bacteroidales bacterium]MCF8405796.1 B12-binding domain-containing radical SAM protein [Bacteroidales bacterium]
MKVMLLQPTAGISTNDIYVPKYTNPPMGLAYIAGYLESNNIETYILDCYVNKYSIDQINNFILDFRPEIIGITSTTTLIYDAYYIAEIIKRKYPEILIVFGGSHATALPKEVASKHFVNIVCIGEGEKTMLDIVKVFNNNKDFEKIEGIAIWKNNSVVIRKRNNFFQDIDSLPYPAYHLLDFNKYNPKHQWGKNRQWTPIVTGRGCPYHCVFCQEHSIFGKTTRYRSAESILDEIVMLKKNYNKTHFTFIDSTFTENHSRIVEVTELIIERKIRISWNCNSRVDTLPNTRVLIKMRESGCNSIFLGIESGNSEFLQRYKTTTIKQCVKAVVALKNNHINSHCSFMFGLPGENKSTIDKTIHFSKILNPTTASFHIVVPFPGTPLFNLYNREGKIISKDWSKYYREPVIKLEDCSTDELRGLRIAAFKRFYFRPSYIIKSIRNVNNFKQLIDFALLGIRLIFNKIGVGLGK